METIYINDKTGKPFYVSHETDNEGDNEPPVKNIRRNRIDWENVITTVITFICTAIGATIGTIIGSCISNLLL